MRYFQFFKVIQEVLLSEVAVINYESLISQQQGRIVAYKGRLFRIVQGQLGHLPSEIGPASIWIELLLLQVSVSMERVASVCAFHTSWS